MLTLPEGSTINKSTVPAVSLPSYILASFKNLLPSGKDNNLSLKFSFSVAYISLSTCNKVDKYCSSSSKKSFLNSPVSGSTKVSKAFSK